MFNSIVQFPLILEILRISIPGSAVPGVERTKYGPTIELLIQRLNTLPGVHQFETKFPTKYMTRLLYLVDVLLIYRVIEIWVVFERVPSIYDGFVKLTANRKRITHHSPLKSCILFNYWLLIHLLLFNIIQTLETVGFKTPKENFFRILIDVFANYIFMRIYCVCKLYFYQNIIWN